MGREENWNKNYQEIMDFMERTMKAPSKHRIEEHRMLNWIKYQRKCVAKGSLKNEHMEKFQHLQDMMAKYRRVNQYQYTNLQSPVVVADNMPGEDE